MIIKSKLIFVLLLFLLSGTVVGAYKYFFVSKELPHEFALVEKGNIIQKVSATGQIVPAKSIDLQFEIQGKIKEIKVDVGQQVKTGNALVILDTTELNTNFLEAEAACNVAQAKLDQVLAGASEEEIKVYETAVENSEIALQNAQISLKNAEQNLADVKIDAENDLNQAYEDALDILNTSYTVADRALLKTLSGVQRKYFYSSDQTAINVKDKKVVATIALVGDSYQKGAKDYVDEANDNLTQENIDLALTELKSALGKIRNALSVIREAMDEPVYRASISTTDESNIDTERTNVDGAITNITTAQQKIATQEITNQTNINAAQSELDTAQNAVTTAEGNLKSSQDKLTQIKALPQEAEVSLAKAQLNQAEAALVRAKQQLAKATLATPLTGAITDIKKEIGETVTTQDAVVTIITLSNFQIEVDIPEVDIGKVDLQDIAEVSLDAFPEEVFLGKVIKINPAETIIQGVVYYQATIGFEKEDPRLKSGMTANIDIITETKEDVLTIPQRAVFTKNGQKQVRILEGEEIKEIKVETGIRGSEGKIEILSGLKEGDRVITFLKQKND